MKNYLKLVGIIAMVTVIGFGLTACDSGGGNGGGGDDNNGGGTDLVAKLTAGTGKWVKDTDSSVWVQFTNQPDSSSGKKVIKISTSQKMGGESEQIFTHSDLNISGNTISFGFGVPLRMTLTSDTTATIVAESNPDLAANGNFTLQK